MMSTLSLSELVPIMKEVFAVGKTVTLPAKGRSMRPLLRDGVDSVVLAGYNSEKPLRRLDVPLYHRSDGKEVLHRVVRVRDGHYTMCGDAQTALETGITDVDIDAIAVGFVRGGRYISVKNPTYRLYSFLWCLIRPWRGHIFAFCRKMASLFKKRNKEISIIKKFNGRMVSYVTRRVEDDGGVRDEIVGKSGRISYLDGKVSIICSTDDVYVSRDGSTRCNMLMSGNGATVEGNNEVTGSYDKIIVYFSKF